MHYQHGLFPAIQARPAIAFMYQGYDQSSLLCDRMHVVQLINRILQFSYGRYHAPKRIEAELL